MNYKLSKKGMAQVLADRIGLEKVDAQICVDTVIEEIARSIVRYGDISILNFGRFRYMPQGYIKFTPEKSLKEAIAMGESGLIEEYYDPVTMEYDEEIMVQFGIDKQ